MVLIIESITLTNCQKDKLKVYNEMNTISLERIKTILKNTNFEEFNFINTITFSQYDPFKMKMKIANLDLFYIPEWKIFSNKVKMNESCKFKTVLEHKGNFVFNYHSQENIIKISFQEEGDGNYFSYSFSKQDCIDFLRIVPKLIKFVAEKAIEQGGWA